MLLVASASGRACRKWGVGAAWLSLLQLSPIDGVVVVVAGPAVAVWLLGYSRRGISPTLGDLACAAVRGCVLGYSQWGISLPLAAPGPGNRHDLASGGVRALRAARRCYCCCDLPTALELRDASCVRVWWWSSRVHRASVLAAADPRPPRPGRVGGRPPALAHARVSVLQARALLPFPAGWARASGPIPDRMPRCSG